MLTFKLDTGARYCKFKQIAQPTHQSTNITVWVRQRTPFKVRGQFDGERLTESVDVVCGTIP